MTRVRATVVPILSSTFSGIASFFHKSQGASRAETDATGPLKGGSRNGGSRWVLRRSSKEAEAEACSPNTRKLKLVLTCSSASGPSTPFSGNPSNMNQASGYSQACGPLRLCNVAFSMFATTSFKISLPISATIPIVNPVLVRGRQALSSDSWIKAGRSFGRVSRRSEKSPENRDFPLKNRENQALTSHPWTCGFAAA